MKFYTVDVMIPTYKPGQEFAELLPRLLEQTYPIRSIRVVNTGKKFWNPAWEQLSDKIMVEHIRPSEFDHGGTRRAMAESSDADLLLFMTQDAMPYDNACVEHLVEKFSLPHVKAAYARQLPRDDCRTLERFTRGFNYPEESDIKDAGDLPKLGVKTFFCSNVCAMYDRRTYEELGGFVESTLFNEDMIYAGHLVQAGYAIAYAADAYPSEGEGIRMVKKSASYVCKIHKPWLLVTLFFQSGFKYVGYFLGKRYKSLPDGVIRWCTSNKTWWEYH